MSTCFRNSILVLVIGLFMSAFALAAKPTLYVKGSQLYAPDGEPILLRGINHMFIWTDKEGKSIPEMAKTGANSVRIVWDTYGATEDLDKLIVKSINNGMIPIVEVHGATGKWEKLPEMVDYWVRPDVVNLIKKYERYLLVNIANEAGKDAVPSTEYLAVYKAAILKIRKAGIRSPLVIDADGYGNNPNNLLSQGQALIAADPRHNLLLSLHIYWPYAWHDKKASGYDTVESRITGTMEQAIAHHLPLLIGEFASLGPTKTCDLPIPYQFLIAEAQRLNIGWLAWSWGPGNSDCKDMDMTTNGEFSTLVGWGLDVAVTNTYSIKNTSKRPAFISEHHDKF